LVERLHAVELAVGDNIRQLAGPLSIHNALLDPLGVDQDLDRGDPTLPISPLQKALTDDPPETAGDHQTDLMLLVRREEVDDAVHCLCRVDGVKGREHEMAGFGCFERRVNGLGVAHLTYLDDIGILTKDPSQGLGEGLGVHPYLALADDGQFVGVQHLDGILQRDDVAATIRVDVVDDGRLGSALARPGRASDQYESPRLLGQRGQDVGKAQLLEVLARRGNGAEHQRHRPPLPIGVHPEPTKAGPAESEIGFAGVSEICLQVLRHHVVRNGHSVLGSQLGEVGKMESAVDAIHRRGPHLQVKVRALHGDELSQELFDAGLFLRHVVTFARTRSDQVSAAVHWGLTRLSPQLRRN
jgi:hypothetical protein